MYECVCACVCVCVCVCVSYECGVYKSVHERVVCAKNVCVRLCECLCCVTLSGNIYLAFSMCMNECVIHTRVRLWMQEWPCVSSSSERQHYCTLSNHLPTLVLIHDKVNNLIKFNITSIRLNTY
uniref:Uncharacterized protein n=1 Tax=Octopus bimaculoides TaxID=37653 RepID=A0A0L8FLW3_OCTBM